MKTLSIFFVLIIGAAYAADEASIRDQVKSQALGKAGIANETALSALSADNGKAECHAGYFRAGDDTSVLTGCAAAVVAEGVTDVMHGATTTAAAMAAPALPKIISMSSAAVARVAVVRFD